MAKSDEKKPETVASPIGENTVVTLTLKKEAHEREYQKVLASYASSVTLPGFRKGKAPKKLAEENVGSLKLIEYVLERLVPDLYSAKIKELKLIPLVSPQVQAKSIEPGQDWVIEASTAVAPVVILGDWKKILKEAAKNLPKKDTPEEKDEDLANKQLSYIFGALIQSINPKIAPLLLENETRKQLEDFARHLASHRIELDTYLKQIGKDINALQQEYMANALATLQLEFVLLQLTKELAITPTKEEIEAFAGESLSKMDKKFQDQMREEATAIVARKKTVEAIKHEAGITA